MFKFIFYFRELNYLIELSLSILLIYKHIQSNEENKLQFSMCL